MGNSHQNPENWWGNSSGLWVSCCQFLLWCLKKIMYLFIYGCARSLLLCVLFSSCRKQVLLLWRWCMAFSLLWLLLLQSMDSKLQQGITSHWAEWSPSKSLQITNSVESVTERESSYTVGGNVNWLVQTLWSFSPKNENRAII